MTLTNCPNISRDRSLGLMENFQLSDERLADPAYYEGLDSRALNTSWEDWETIGRFLENHGVGSLLDIGCGVGRGLIHLGHRMKVHGLDFHPERIELARSALKKVGLDPERASHADVTKSDLPESEAYYLYFPTGEVLDHILIQLKKRRSRNFWLIAMESHGDLIATLEEDCPWLELQSVEQSNSPRHREGIFFFRSKQNFEETMTSPLLETSAQLIVEDDRGYWLADSKGLDRRDYPQLTSTYPLNRPFTAANIRGKLFPGKKLDHLCELRRNGSPIRKIRLGEYISLEMASGEIVRSDSHPLA